MVFRTYYPGVYIFPVREEDTDGTLLTDNALNKFNRTVHPTELKMEIYITNRDEFLYHDLTRQSEIEFDALLFQECKRQQLEARKRHIIEQGIPGY